MNMTANQYREAIAALNLSQVGAAKMFGIGDRSSRRFASDGEQIPWTVEMLLRLMVAKGITPEEIESIPEHERLPRVTGIIFHLLASGRVSLEDALAAVSSKKRRK